MSLITKSSQGPVGQQKVPHSLPLPCHARVNVCACACLEVARSCDQCCQVGSFTDKSAKSGNILKLLAAEKKIWHY